MDHRTSQGYQKEARGGESFHKDSQKEELVLIADVLTSLVLCRLIRRPSVRMRISGRRGPGWARCGLRSGSTIILDSQIASPR